MTDHTFRQSLQLLFTRRFGTFWFASLLSSIGTWSQQVAQPWLMLSLGATPFLLGLDSFAMGAPVFALTLIGGALADHGDRRRVIAFFQSIQFLCPVAVVVLLLLGRLQPWMVILLSLVIGITDALSMPSYQTIVPSIVRRDQIPAAIALNSSQFNLSRILGPALAGILLVTVGATGAFSVSAASYLPFILVAVWILPPGRPTPLAERLGYQQLRAGISQALRQPALRGALLTVLTNSLLCAPVVTFVPVLIKQTLRGGVGHLSLTLSAFGVGGLIGAIALLGVNARVDRRPMSSLFATAYALVVVLVALVPRDWTLPLLFALAGISMTGCNASAQSLIQTTAQANLRGQSMSLYMLSMRGGLALGALLTGSVVSLIGVRATLLADGLLALVLQLIIARGWRRASRLVPTDAPA
jgi:predicted MFS family arabinose efflux permease